MKGKVKASASVPSPLLQIMVVNGSSLATIRVVRCWVANRQAVISPMTTPITGSPAEGLMTNSTPMNPTPAATQRVLRIGSLRIQGATDNMISGEIKMMAVASACGK